MTEEIAIDWASAKRQARAKALWDRERLRPCLVAYDKLLNELGRNGIVAPEVEAMAYITSIFRETYQEVLVQIEEAGKSGISQTNSVKRSAGTNFQGLCEYAIIKWLDTTSLPFNVGPNAPKSMKDELTIYGEDADGGSFSVEPDIDISLWIDDGADNSPVIFLSAKTSLVDRAGQAARWKMYLDLHQTSCVHFQSVADCPINRTRVRMKTKHPITHCIVTANIYKIDTTQPYGELESGQCRNNTYMFKNKYTTRNDPDERRPASWKSFSEFTKLVREVYHDYKQLREARLILS